MSISVIIDGTPVVFEDQQPITSQSWITVPVRDLFRAMGYTVGWINSTRTTTLTKGEYRVSIRAGDAAFTRNGESIGFTSGLVGPTGIAQIVGGRMMVPFRRILESVGCTVVSEPGKIVVSTPGAGNKTYPQKILIDAGHIPGWNSADNGYVEGDRMWDLQNLIVEELQSIGFATAQRLRTRNERIIPQNPGENLDAWNLRDNEERGKRAAGCDLFIQLHTDAAGRPDASHAVVYYPMDGRNNSQSLGNSFADAIKTTMGLSGNSRVETRVSDGVEAFRVMRGAHSVNCPRYFITENGFHTTSSTTLWLMQDSNLRRLARAYAEVIRDLFS